MSSVSVFDKLFCVLVIAWSLDAVLEVVQGADKDQKHLSVKAGDIIPNHEDDGSEFASNGDGVLGVHFLVLISDTWRDQVLVDNARLN